MGLGQLFQPEPPQQLSSQELEQAKEQNKITQVKNIFQDLNELETNMVLEHLGLYKVVGCKVFG